jgi:hypothetical protein
MTTFRFVRAAIALIVVIGIQSTGHGQSPTAASDLAAQLRERYDVVALQRGVAFVPLDASSSVRMVQIVDGVVTVDGVSLTGQQLRTSLGDDADLILQVSYLDRERQRELADDASATGPIPSEDSGFPEAIERGQVTRGDTVRFGGDVTVGRDERIEGDLVSIGGSIELDGEVTGDVVGIGGAVTLGPQAVVRGDLSVVGGSLARAPGARVFGDTNEVGAGPDGFADGRLRSRAIGSFRPRVGSLTATAVRLTLLVLLGLIALTFARQHVERISGITAASPLRAGLVGLLAEIVFLPAIVLLVVVLAVSIVGIPLLALVPFVMILVILVMLTGFVALAYRIGGQLTARFGWTDRGGYAAVATGIVAIGGLTLMARLAAVVVGSWLGAPLTALGFIVEYAAWTVGFGSAVIALYEMQTGFRSHPAVPATQTDNASPGSAS